MTAQRVHIARIQEHLQVLKDAIAVGIEHRPATIGFHASACSIDLLELYLHKMGKIPIGMQVKHDWFKRPKPGQKIQPLAERYLQVEFPQKARILELLYTLEEKRNKLIYGHTTPPEIAQTQETFVQFKNLLIGMLQEQGENLEDTDL